MVPEPGDGQPASGSFGVAGWSAAAGRFVTSRRCSAPASCTSRDPASPAAMHGPVRTDCFGHRERNSNRQRSHEIPPPG